MAYEVKFELFFSDVENNKFKIEILEKDFVLDRFGTGVQPTQLIGTSNPAIIEWDSDDDIYSPIIGSRCILNFFVTDSNTYDDFFKAGERQYKVKVLQYESYQKNWEDEELKYEQINQNWDAKLGAEIFYEPIWEGFIVNDGYREAVISAPFELKLEAIDGLGTLDTFDVPFPSDNTSSKQSLFFYLKEILKLTGHEFDIYINNDIRKTGGATNDTIFHDIEVNRYIFSNNNLILRNAKDSLKEILKVTNSRIFQSFAHWYVINNSSIIDNRVDQGTYGASGADIANETAQPTPANLYNAPLIEIIGESVMYVGGNYVLTVLSSQNQPVAYQWTRPDSSTVSQTIGTANFGELSTGVLALSNNSDVYQLTATDSDGNTHSDTFTLNVQSAPTQTETQSGGATTGITYFQINLGVTDSVSNAYVSTKNIIITYAAGEVGNSFTSTFNVVSNNGEFTSVNNITSVETTIGTATKTLVGNIIRVTISGTLVTGGHVGNVVVRGSADTRRFTHTYILNVSGLSNISLSTADLVASKSEGESYTLTRTLSTSSGFEFKGGIGSAAVISAIQNTGLADNITVTKNSDTSATLTITGTMGVTNESANVTLSGSAISNTPATSVSASPSALDLANNSGFVDLTVTANGNFSVGADRPFLSFVPSTGVSGTQNIRVRFSANQRVSTRSNTINFFPRASTSVIGQVSVTQDGLA